MYWVSGDLCPQKLYFYLYICRMKQLITSIIASLLLGIVFAGCGGNPDVERRLDRADILINRAPDSALIVLDSLDADNLKGSQLARYGLLYTKAANKNHTPLADDSLIGMAVDYYADRGDSLEIQSLYYQAQIYSTLWKLDTALLCLNDVYDKSIDMGDSFYAAMSAREITAIYGRLLIPGQELKWSQAAKQLFIEAGKPVHAAWMDIFISNAFTYTGDYDSAERILNSVDSSQYDTNPSFRHKILLSKVELAAQRHQYGQIAALFDTLINDGYRMTAHNYCRLADTEMSIGNYDSIKRYIELIETLPLNREDTLYVNRVRAKYLASTGDYQAAYQAASDYAASLMRYDDDKLTNPQTILLTNTLRSKIAEEKIIAKKSREITMILIVLFIIVVALTIMVLLYLRARLVNKSLEADKAFHDALRLKNELEEMEKRLTDTQEQSVRQNTDLAIQLNNKSVEADRASKDALLLKRELETMEMRMNHDRQKSAEKLVLQQEHNKALATDMGHLFSRHVDMLQNLAVAYYSRSNDGDKDTAFYRGVETTLKNLRSIEVFDELSAVIDIRFDGWMSKFKAAYPGLKEGQYILAMYIFIGLSSEAISVLTGKKTLMAVYMEKNKLKKRMLEINGGQPDSFMMELRMYA